MLDTGQYCSHPNMSRCCKELSFAVTCHFLTSTYQIPCIVCLFEPELKCKFDIKLSGSHCLWAVKALIAGFHVWSYCQDIYYIPCFLLFFEKWFLKNNWLEVQKIIDSRVKLFCKRICGWIWVQGKMILEKSQSNKEKIFHSLHKSKFYIGGVSFSKLSLYYDSIFSLVIVLQFVSIGSL